MSSRNPRSLSLVLVAAALAGAAIAAHAEPPAAYPFDWSTVVNNGDFMPTAVCDPAAPGQQCRKFNSYNQPSVNAHQVVVIRARSKGGSGSQPVHGVYVRDMVSASPLRMILDRATAVPQPNNRNTVFIEPPSFPRIDIWSDTMATRGNHQPVWNVLEGGSTVESVGTTGIYTNPFGPLTTGTSKLGSVTNFSFFEVPEVAGTPFDVFPGSPAVADGATLAFKGNYTVNGGGKTGVYYRELTNASIPLSDGSALGPAAGTNPVVLIANNTDTLIPGTSTVFGSTSPPSAARGRAVFAGFDDEESPTLGGIYMAPLAPYPAGAQPRLKALVRIGSKVPGESGRARFTRLGEGVSFDGRFVGFWGAWGTQTRTVRLYCPQEGNKARIAYCNQKLVVNGAVVGDPASVCGDTSDPMYGTSCYQEKQVPVNQGIFVHDTGAGVEGVTHAVAKTGGRLDDFLYWNYSGRAPGVGEGGEGGDDDGEPARWRSTAFMAVSGLVDGHRADATFHAAFKARSGTLHPVTHAWVSPLDGIYLRRGPGMPPLQTLVRTGMDGSLLDPEAVDGLGAGLPVTEMGIERDGFRGRSIVINVSMGSEDAGWAGVYLTEVPWERHPER